MSQLSRPPSELVTCARDSYPNLPVPFLLQALRTTGEEGGESILLEDVGFEPVSRRQTPEYQPAARTRQP
eukprot:1369833-Amorphochlora_amoeboformis.AAC.2